MSLENVENLLSENIGAGKKFINCDIRNLVGPGENFGGEVLKLTINVENEITKETEVLHAVAKKIPESEIFQDIFNVQTTFKSEVAFYKTLVPTFKQFQQQQGVSNVLDCFADIYGSRINLNASDIVDRNAALVLENLTISGYKNIDRYIGFDNEEAKLVLKELAAFHSVTLGIKIKNEDSFKNDVKPHLNEKMKPNTFFSEAIVFLSEILFESDKCASAVTKVQTVWKLFNDITNVYQPREPFATISHNDLWINNIMIKHDNGKPSKIKFVDFQIYSYKSPVMDLLFFLFTSVQTEVLKRDIDKLIKFYHNELMANLTQFGCNKESFSFAEFQKELQKDAHLVMCWVLSFIPFVIFGPKDKIPQAPEGNIDMTSYKVRDEIRKSMPYVAKEKIQFIVEYCEKKNWI